MNTVSNREIEAAKIHGVSVFVEDERQKTAVSLPEGRCIVVTMVTVECYMDDDYYGNRHHVTIAGYRDARRIALKKVRMTGRIVYGPEFQLPFAELRRKHAFKKVLAATK